LPFLDHRRSQFDFVYGDPYKNVMWQSKVLSSKEKGFMMVVQSFLPLHTRLMSRLEIWQSASFAEETSFSQRVSSKQTTIFQNHQSKYSLQPALKEFIYDIYITRSTTLKKPDTLREGHTAAN
jgi:hypothetical protein